MHLPRNSKRTTESNHFNSKRIWKDGNNGRRNRRFCYRYWKTSKVLKSACASGGTVKAAPSNSKASTRSASQRSLNRMDTKWRCAKNIMHAPWFSGNRLLGRSNLVGVTGMIVETRRTLRVRTIGGEVTLPKDVITFTIDSERSK